MRSAVPNRLMDYLWAALAVVASDQPGDRSVLDGTGATIFIDPVSPETIAEGIGSLLDDPRRIGEMKRTALETARRYEWSVQAEKLIAVYESVLGEGGHSVHTFRGLRRRSGKLTIL